MRTWDCFVGDQTPARFREYAEARGEMTPETAVDNYIEGLWDHTDHFPQIRAGLIMCLAMPIRKGGAGWRA